MLFNLGGEPQMTVEQPWKEIIDERTREREKLERIEEGF
jgi:hypothetical protein